MEQLAARLNGIRFNELGFALSLEASTSGQLSGTFRSGVGDGLGQRPLRGLYSPSPQSGEAVLGFVVVWPSSHSLSSWSGHLHHDDVITATWLLASSTDASDEWRSMHIGHDRFARRSFEN